MLSYTGSNPFQGKQAIKQFREMSAEDDFQEEVPKERRLTR